MAESTEHEALVSLFRDRQELLRELVEPLGYPFAGEATVATSESNLTQAKPLLARADVVQLHRSGGKVELVTVVEVQLRRKRSKRLRWPLYGTTARVLFRCEAALVVVVAPDPAVAEWARQPIPLGGRSVFHPVVLGPSEIPRPQSPDEPLEKLLLGVRAHPDRTAAEVALEAANRLPEGHRAEYTDVLLGLLPEALRKEFLDMVTTRSRLYPMSDFAKEHYGKGQVELLLRQLTRRFGELPPETVERVRAAEGDQLLLWADRVLDAPSLEAVFADQD